MDRTIGSNTCVLIVLVVIRNAIWGHGRDNSPLWDANKTLQIVVRIQPATDDTKAKSTTYACKDTIV